MLALRLEKMEGLRQPRLAESDLALLLHAGLWPGPITDGYTGVQTVITRHTAKLREQIETYQQVAAFDGGVGGS